LVWRNVHVKSTAFFSPAVPAPPERLFNDAGQVDMSVWFRQDWQIKVIRFGHIRRIARVGNIV
jgi:hypothetical protein